MTTTQVVETSVYAGLHSPRRWYSSLGGRGEGGGVRRLGPPPPPYLALVWDWNSCIDRIVYHSWTGWFFLMKRALHFATKLNSKDNQKFNCFWVPSYDLFASARNAVHGRGPRNYNVQPRLVGGDVGWSNLPQKVQQPFPNQSLPLPLPQSKLPVDPPLQNHL